MTENENFTTVPTRWIGEVILALDAATTISHRALRTGRPEGLDTGNHDRLIAEAHAHGWSGYAKKPPWPRRYIGTSTMAGTARAVGAPKPSGSKPASPSRHTPILDRLEDLVRMLGFDAEHANDILAETEDALTEERRAHERTRGEVERLRNGLPSPDSIRYGIEPEPWEGNGPCADCEGRSPYWHVPDEIWDAVMGDVSAGVVCPVCFTIRAWKAGIDGWDRQWWWLPSPDFLAVPNADFIRAMDELIATEATLEARNREVERLAKALEDIANRSTACRVSGCDRNFCEHYIAGISPHDFAVAALATPPPTPTPGGEEGQNAHS